MSLGDVGFSLNVWDGDESFEKSYSVRSKG